jgi:amidophosphoribosyltransferase
MCGIFGIANHSDAATLTYLGLYALQHRGQESTGISSSDGEKVFTHKSLGHVADVYTEDVLSKLKATMPLVTPVIPRQAKTRKATLSPSS